MRLRDLAPLVLCASIGASAGAAANETKMQILKPKAGPLALSNSFNFTSSKTDPEKAARDIEDQRRAPSGIAFAKPGVFLIAFDEGVSARFVKLTLDSYEAFTEPVSLPATDKEADAEGVTVDDKYFYVVGSHANKRKSGNPNPGSRMLARFEIAEDGRAQTPGETGDLWSAIAKTELFPFMEKPLGTQPLEGDSTKIGESGLDIEGVATREGKLLFGLRGPSKDATAKILTVDAKAVFVPGSPDAKAEVLTVEVGDKRAIRDMQTVKDGVLLLVGPDDDARDSNSAAWVSWRLLLWDGASHKTKLVSEFDLTGLQPRTLGGCKDKAAKLEGFAVTEDRDDGWLIVAISDGLCDGGPMWFDVKRP